jgi:serine/threonine protein kinase
LAPRPRGLCAQEGPPRVITARLGDFGISKLYASDPGGSHTMAPFGTPGYIAPEVMEGVIAPSGKADVYSFGILVLQVGD